MERSNGGWAGVRREEAAAPEVLPAATLAGRPSVSTAEARSQMWNYCNLLPKIRGFEQHLSARVG